MIKILKAWLVILKALIDGKKITNHENSKYATNTVKEIELYNNYS